MWIAKCYRDKLLNLINDHDPLSLFDIRQSKKVSEFSDENELLLLWKNKPSRSAIPLPDLICVQKGMIRDFLAWASTYIRAFKPFTSFCRVIESPNFNYYKTRLISFTNKKIEAPIVGAIIGEAITHKINNNFKNLLPSAIMSSLSFSLAKGLQLGIEHEDYENLFHRWIQARQLTKQNIRVFDHKRIKAIWDILLNKKSDDTGFEMRGGDFNKLISEAYNSVKVEGVINKEVLNKLLKNQINGQFLYSTQHISREESIKHFEKLSKLFNQQFYSDKSVGSFLFGYLAYKIAPGQIDFFNLLIPHLKNFPDSILWYCIFASHNNSAEILNYNDGLGWRLMRNLSIFSDIFERPQCDLSFEELEVYLSVDRPNFDFIADNNTHLIIEVLPMVDITMHWPPVKSNEQLDLFKTDNEIARKENALEKLGEAIRNAQNLFYDYRNIEKSKKYQNNQYKKRR